MKGPPENSEGPFTHVCTGSLFADGTTVVDRGMPSTHHTPDHSLRSRHARRSILSIRSEGSILSIGSAYSILSIGSVGSVLSIGSVGSAGSALSTASFASLGSALSGLSRWSLMSWRGWHDSPPEHPHLTVIAEEPDLARDATAHVQS